MIAKTDLKAAFLAALKEFSRDGGFGCCKERCTEKCGFGPVDHARMHREAAALVESVSGSEKIFKSGVMKAITAVIIALFGFGAVSQLLSFISGLSEKIKILQ
ncbi:MAG: hypothetical protein RBT11_19595 [Desulfobacterales bacterium]|nr:hypothetical protein [Desulfobacterales bacterium]